MEDDGHAGLKTEAKMMSRWLHVIALASAAAMILHARAAREGTDDAAFIVRLAEEFIADGVADPRRVYVTGISNGAAMAMTMICERADLFAAHASVIMNLTDEFAAACQPSRAVPFLLM